jgi:hypothetical protein
MCVDTLVSEAGFIVLQVVCLPASMRLKVPETYD